MSNLGRYQTMTTLAKKVGGPLNLAGAIVVGGIVVWEGGKFICKQGISTFSNWKEKRDTAKEYEIQHKFVDEHVVLDKGDKIKVLALANDVALIEKIDDTNNPYCISINVLTLISDYS